MPKLLAWNILHGGSSRRLPQIALSLLEHDADTIVLTEFRTHVGGQLRGLLADHGWHHQRCTQPPPRTNGILIASRSPLEDPRLPEPPESLSQRWLGARLPDLGLDLLALHLPDRLTDARRLVAWNALLDLARAARDTHLAIVGDLNAGRTGRDSTETAAPGSTLMGKLWSLGYRDAWREFHPDAREYSWFSHTGSGFRLDHAIVANPLFPRVSGAWYAHRERADRLSDHAPLVVEFA
ncbi:MAG: endonuclease/exonuclease/phosphatase family protein [Phycisphaerales bacterium JB037]